MADPIKVLIAGPDEEACLLLRFVLDQADDIAIVGFAVGAAALGPQVSELAPDVVLLGQGAHDEPAIASAVKGAKALAAPPIFVALTSDRRGGDLAALVDLTLDDNLPLELLPGYLVKLARRGPDPSAEEPPVCETAGAPVDAPEARPADSMEQRQSDLEEQLGLVHLWLNGAASRATSASTAIDSAPARLTNESPAREGELAEPRVGADCFSLSVDSFFNAQHKVAQDGVEGKMHHHSWRVNARLRQRALSDNHTVLGFAEAKNLMRGVISSLDGKTLNDLPELADMPPTTENVAWLLFNKVKSEIVDSTVILESITIWESPTNAITYSEDCR